MKIFVAGASGVLGRQLVQLLAEAGHEVVGTTTSPRKLETLRALGAQPVVLDLLDAEAVGRAVSRAEPEVVVHAATALSGIGGSFRKFDETFAQTNRLRTQGTEPARRRAGRGGCGSSLRRAMRAGPMRARARP